MNAAAFLGALREAGVTHVVGLPDQETSLVFEQLGQETCPRRVLVCREGEALAIAAGLWGGGRQPLVLMQSTGFFESGDSLRSAAFELEAPLDLVLGYRGYSGKPNAGYPDTARDCFEPLLAAWGLQYAFLEEANGYLKFARRLREQAARERGINVYLLPQ